MARIASWLGCVLLVAVLGSRADASSDEAEPPTDPADAPAAEPEAPPEPPEAPSLLAPQTPVGDLLRALGDPPAEHWMPPAPQLAAQGEAIVLSGRGEDPFGKAGPRVSAAFDCTDCHNVVREDPSLAVSDPEARQSYALEHGLKLLPATTLWGIVNREAWFNDDYIKKYGSLVKSANKSLRWAIQLCSAECSQGRTLADWEMDAVLTYLWTLQMTVGDLALSDEARTIVSAALENTDHRAAAVAAVKSHYLRKSPAHTGEPPADREAGYAGAGDAARGEFVFKEGCLVCHDRGGPGTYRLGANKASYRELLRFRTAEDGRSFYETVRHGTRPYGVPMAYMPFYTKERLSDQQLDDLLAFLQAEVAK